MSSETTFTQHSFGGVSDHLMAEGSIFTLLLSLLGLLDPLRGIYDGRKNKMSVEKPDCVAKHTHHLEGSRAEVQIGDGRVVCLQDVEAFPGQGLDDRLVALEGGGLLSVQDEPTHPAVELSRQQQADDGGLDVLLVVLVCVEGVVQVRGDVIWKE